MAAKRTYEHRHMITRTVTTTTATVTYFDGEAGELKKAELSLHGKVKEYAFMKKAYSQIKGSDIKICMISDLKTTERLYGATLEDFLSVAQEIK